MTVEARRIRRKWRGPFGSDKQILTTRDALKDALHRKIGVPLLRLSTRTETGREGEKPKPFLLGMHSSRIGRDCPLRAPES